MFCFVVVVVVVVVAKFMFFFQQTAMLGWHDMTLLGPPKDKIRKDFPGAKFVDA